MRGFTKMSIIYAALLIYIGAISGMRAEFKMMLFIIIDLTFLRIIFRRKDPYEKKFALVLIIYSIVLPMTYGAFSLLKHSNEEMKEFGTFLLIVCIITIILSILYSIKTIKKITMINFEKNFNLIFYKIDGIDDKILYLQNEIAKFSGKDREKTKFLYMNLIEYNLQKIEEIDDKILYLQNEFAKLSKKDREKIKVLYTNIIESHLSEIDAIDDKILFLKNGIEKWSEKDNVVRKILEEKIQYFDINRERIEEERIWAEEKEKEEAKIYNEMAGYVENKDFFETDLDHIFGEDEGCFFIIDDVRRVTKYYDNKGHGRFREMYRGTLYITNKKLWLKLYRETNPIMVLNPLTDILEIYKSYRLDDEFHYIYVLKLIINKRKKEENILLEMDDEMDAYKAMICIEEAQKYL